jgi:hypothetical protein
MSYNCAILIQVDQEIYHDPKMYTVSTLENKDSPTENLPEGWNVVEYVYYPYKLILDKTYKTFSTDVVVVDEVGDPQWLVGEFEEYEEQK